jgi:hypothetical protein
MSFSGGVAAGDVGGAGLDFSGNGTGSPNSMTLTVGGAAGLTAKSGAFSMGGTVVPKALSVSCHP